MCIAWCYRHISETYIYIKGLESVVWWRKKEKERKKVTRVCFGISLQKCLAGSAGSQFGLCRPGHTKRNFQSQQALEGAQLHSYDPRIWTEEHVHIQNNSTQLLRWSIPTHEHSKLAVTAPMWPRSQVAAILAAMSCACAALQEWPPWCHQTGLTLPFPSPLCLANSLDTCPHARAVLTLCLKSCLLACDLRDLILRTPCGTSLMDRIDTRIMRECEKKMI